MPLRSVHWLCLWLLAGCTLSARSMGHERPTMHDSAEAIIARVEQPYAGIEDYTVDLDVDVDIQGLTIPPVHATMYFKRPDKVAFMAKGFALLPREAAAFGIGRLRSLNTIEPEVTREVVDGEIRLKVSMVPKADKSGLGRIALYVDSLRWTADRAVSSLPDGRIVTARFHYRWQDSIWLPSSLDLSFSSLSADTADLSFLKEFAPNWTAKPPREGKVSVRYSHYRLNSGLSDDIFKAQEDADR